MLQAVSESPIMLHNARPQVTECQMASSPLDPLVSEIDTLINNGDIEDAFERLRNYLHDNNPKLYNEVLNQAGRFSTQRNRNLAGSITSEHYTVEENRIRNWLIDFVAKLPSRIERKLVPVPPDPRPNLALSQIEQTSVAPEKILGINNLKQISWLERGIQVCSSVCRVLTPNGLGTGFLISSGYVMTNNHVIASAEVAAQTVVEFDYQQDGSGALLPSYRYRLDHSQFHTNAALDYTLVRVIPEAGKPALEHWRYLRLNPNADPLPTEHVSIVQHPNGGLKQIVLTANWVIDAKPPLLHYTTDTMAGSSGSPVFNDSWHVIAIHHAAVPSAGKNQNYVNEGILMSAIRADAGNLWPQQ
jgi:V8-like Glu-specific endopeptidase